jgi:hypothetical protein
MSFHLTHVTKEFDWYTQNNIHAHGGIRHELCMYLAEINNVSMQMEATFHLTHITWEFHQVCRK